MISLRSIKLNDIEDYKYWLHPSHQYHQFNGPYYKKSSENEIEIIVNDLKDKLASGIENPQENKKLIVDNNDQIIGEVSYYWRSIETKWLEVGLILFDEKNWNQGLGQEALRLWINELFSSKSELIRIGLTTWSGNIGMIKLAEKIGMHQEACYKNARIVDGQYYDSVSYGIQKREWQLNLKK